MASHKSASIPIPDENVVVLDFGAQYTQLIARRVRECKVYCEILPCETPLAEIAKRKPIGIIFSGGPASCYEPGAPEVDMAIYDLGIPILGICYGMQLMSRQLGGKVRAGTQREYGKTALDVTDNTDLFLGLNRELICWMSHGDTVEAPPPGFKITAMTASTPVAAMADTARKFFAVQFHPEVVHTPWGTEIIRNFLYQFCSAKGEWTMASFVREATEAIRQQVGDKKVVCGLSGGVDSVVAAALVHRAIGDQLTCIFVNTGMMRKDEGTQVRENFARTFNINLVYADEKSRFLDKLKGVIDPEQKRKIIGNEFVAVFDEVAQTIEGAEFLAQGTLYPDVIESGSGKAHTIKTHHNVGGLPEYMKLKLVEPLRYLFKDEVRKVGEELGVPSEMVWRQPFPGPGLGIRVLGEVTREKIDILREADAIVVDEIKKAGLYRRVWQSFAVLPDTKSVGVMGDKRTYEYPIVLRAVSSEDAMTADWARLPYELLEKISSRIVGEVSGVNRVVYDITSKPPGTIEWE
ncbi:glutamine-hydrolyzing GMP synthase [Armatimonas sp.]|uniref:glutamine-hydrolyzing GMP synthase n=1 Tax=Armatimonas sp. TaxID=1872638 RepID=UPI00286BE2F6|nr:glutamine-hydrolyzing GMP synthase [Armatimonas sp.]